MDHARYANENHDGAPRRPIDNDAPSAAQRRIDRLADLLDTRFRLPILGYRFGLDSLIGLIPGVGDAATAAISFYIIFEAARAGAGPLLILRMIYNVVIDAILGSVPVLGDLFDFAFKANLRNANLLREHYARKADADAREKSAVA